MAIQFVVSDGTGLSTATSYVSTADFIQYWENRGVDHSAVALTTIQAWLNRATQYIDDSYNFKGTRFVENQALQWPRGMVVKSTHPPEYWPTVGIGNQINIYDYRTSQYVGTAEIPQSVINATCELGNIASTSTDLYGSASNGVKSISMGKASKTMSGFASSGAKDYPSVSRYLNGLFPEGRLTRA